jgi:glycine betaine/proline transport system permease protein
MDNFKIPIGDVIELILEFLTTNFSGITRAFSAVVELGIDALIAFLMLFPPLLLIAIFVGLIFYFTQRKIAIMALIGLVLIWNMGYWEQTISTLALVVVSTLLAVAIGLPLGILAALNDRFNQIMTPILDFMQTMPAFVYLIPAIPFFGLGVVAAAFATIVFSIPPCIRLTSLGIRQVPADLIEAADAFGSTKWQKLFKVQLPIAVPTIMAGVNQTIMLALSMVVIAAMIGAKGLGGVVWRAIQRLNSGMGFEAGIAIVIIAIVLDRVTKHLTLSSSEKRGLI